ncbi:hypothetical protein ACNAN0_09035 [Agrilactobacillus fermenti]|uniref:hypothetical protein n=1 Tax=Agrilactobacillus fermenti TaxID=2586909 RepID=UPI001E61E368|nr:hypothetical protein [Agrilactobacillus fermenti]MCD2255439.1 hypothetical protein [Agrilactobacillus fermenti]
MDQTKKHALKVAAVLGASGSIMYLTTTRITKHVLDMKRKQQLKHWLQTYINDEHQLEHMVDHLSSVAIKRLIKNITTTIDQSEHIVAEASGQWSEFQQAIQNNTSVPRY